MTESASNTRFSLLQGIYWSAFCVLIGYLVPLYRHYGYSEMTIGTLSMVASLASVVVQPLWGIACDRTGRLRRIFLLNILATIPLSFCLLLGNRSAALMGCAVFLLSSTFTTMGAVLDSWSLKLINQGHSIRYSLTRSFGSLAYAVMAVLFGRLLDVAGMGIIPFAFAVLAGLMILITLYTTAPAREAHHGAGGNPLAAFPILMRNRRFLLMIASMTLLYIGNGAIMVFMPVRMQVLGGSNAVLGIAMTVMALSEVPAMMLHHRLVKHVRNEAILTISLFFFVLKGVATAFAPSTTFLIAAQVLQFAGFGMYLPSAVYHLNGIVEEKNLVTALLIFSSATYGIGMMTGGMLGGVFAEAIGVQPMMLLLTGVTLAGALLYTLGSQTLRHGDAHPD